MASFLRFYGDVFVVCVCVVMSSRFYGDAFVEIFLWGCLLVPFLLWRCCLR